MGGDIPYSMQRAALMGEDGKGGLFELPCFVTHLQFRQDTDEIGPFTGGITRQVVTHPRFTLEGEVTPPHESGLLMSLADQARARRALENMGGLLDVRLKLLQDIQEVIEEWHPDGSLEHIRDLLNEVEWGDPAPGAISTDEPGHGNLRLPAHE